MALVVGAVTNSQKIIDQAMKMEQEGEKMDMCKALEALEQRGFENGLESGKKELIKEKVEKKLARGKSVDIIAEELEEEPEVIRKIMKEIKAGNMEK